MTAKEFIKGCEHDGSYVPVGKVLRLMNEYSCLMCDKQREICSGSARMNLRIPSGRTMTENFYQPDTISQQSILNAPYLHELQRNN